MSTNSNAIPKSRKNPKLRRYQAEVVNEAVSGGETVLRNEVPYLLKISKSAPGQFKLAHVCCRRRSAEHARGLTPGI